MRPRGRSAEIDEMLTIEPPLAVLIMAGIACLESRNIVSTLTCITRRYSSGFSSTTLPRLPMPTLLSRKSSRPQRSTAASTSRLHSASLVTSPACAAAVPPSALIISTVRSASFRSRSATSTLVPARASRIAAARPLPMPSPAAPPPRNDRDLAGQAGVVLGTLHRRLRIADPSRCGRRCPAGLMKPALAPGKWAGQSSALLSTQSSSSWRRDRADISWSQQNWLDQSG